MHWFCSWQSWDVVKGGRGTWVLLGVNAVVVGLWFVLALGSYGTGEEGLRHINRYLARWSFSLFSVVSVASSWHRLFPSGASKWVLAHRRGLGLCFASSMGAHLCTIVWFFSRVPEETLPPAIAVSGGLGYAFIALMAVTSNDRAVRALGRRRWGLVHTIGLTYLWIFFTLTFVLRVLRSIGFLPLVLFCIGLMGFRLWGKARGRQAEPAADA